MPGLYIKCKRCGAEFFSGIAMDKESFETIKLSNLYTCPKCRTTLPYNKEDHFFQQ